MAPVTPRPYLFPPASPDRRKLGRATLRLEPSGSGRRIAKLAQDRADVNLRAGQGVAVREFPLSDGGFADYLLFVDGRAVGVLEAKPAGYHLGGVEPQIDRYSTGLPDGLHQPVTPLPFLYLSTGVETKFINLLDPDPKTRAISAVPQIHRPSTLAEWLGADTLDQWVKRLHAAGGSYPAAAS